MQKLGCVGITGHYANDLAKKAALVAIKLLKKKGVKCEIDLGFSLGNHGVPINDFGCGLILCFGGDGSILHAVRNLKRNLPIMGVNCGSKGYLTEFDYKEFPKKVGEIVEGNFRKELRTRLCVENFKKIPLALNEITLAGAKSGIMMSYDLHIDGKFVWKDNGDGVIVATPTGSTAHALSAGGPEIYGNAKLLSVVPLNSNDRTKRPLVVGDNAVIKLNNYGDDTNCEVIVDGQIRVPVEAELIIKKAKPAVFARLKD